MKALEEENQKLKALVEKLQMQIEGQEYLEKLPEEFKTLKKYFDLDDKRNNSTITPEEKEELRLLTKDSTNPMVEEMENVIRKLITQEYSDDEFFEKHEATHAKYKELLDKEIEKCKENK